MKINVTATEKLVAAISAVEGSRVSARTITAEDIQTEVSRIERKLETLMAKKDWAGVVVSCDINAQTFPASYNGRPESTKFTVERFASGWFVTEIKRGYCNGPAGRRSIKLSDDHKAAMSSFVITNF